MNDLALLSLTLRPKTAADDARLSAGLQRLAAEDPTLRVRTDLARGEVVIAGMGEVHLETILDRLAHEFRVEATVGQLQVAYKETLTRPADGEMRFVAQAHGRGQYAHVKIHLYPAEPGTGYVFEDATRGDAIPRAFITSIDDGIKGALARGVLAGHPVEDVRIQLYDGSYHDADSSAGAFEIAGAMAFQDAATKAAPMLVEPIMRVSVSVPEEYSGGVLAGLSQRRGHVQSQEDRGGAQIIVARVPLSRMLGYATDLRERTRGRATFVMRFDRYERVPPPDDEDDAGSIVGVPRTPSPTSRDARVALPEPDGDADH